MIARSSAPQPPGEPSGADADDLPSGTRLVALEQAARRDGTGLEADQLEGLWLLQRIWPRGQDQPAALSGALLRGLGASLRMERRLGASGELPGGGAGAGAPAVGPAAARAEAPAPAPALRGTAPAPLWLTNSVRLGPLELRFQGPGWLRGRRPLLLFQFERLEIRAGERLLLQRSLPAPEPRRQPFFALIATGADRRWLAARGRSGGLAVWRLSPPTR